MKKHYNRKVNSILRSLRTILSVCILLAGSLNARASHMAGADLTYTYLGNNQYQVTYSFYRDCSGITAPTTEILNISSNACSLTQTATLNQAAQTGQEISFNCPGVSSTCAGGLAPGFQRWEYTAIVTLTAQCPDWNFSVSDCCRNNAITTLTNASGANLYIEANLNNTLVNNNSPTFSNVPVAYMCIGQNNYYNHGVIDADGDSLVYSFISPRTAENTNVIYAAGYSISNPISSSPGVSINSQTGDIFIRPTQVEVGVVAIQVLEYRNGVLIGRVMRDLQIYTTNCQNTLPTISGINGTNTFNTTSCTGGQLCFNIVSNDNDPTQNLVMTWNGGIPAATFTTTGGRLPVGTFCWTPGPGDARPQPYSFTVTVRDDACPSNGVQTYSYNILVSAMTVSVTSSPSVACFGDNTGSASVTATGLAPLRYLWSTNDTTAVVSGLFAGPYTVQVTDASGCNSTRSFTITEPAVLTSTVAAVGGGCTGSSTGSVTANPVGGTLQYSYSWNTTPVATTQTVNNLSDGIYTVTVTDGHGCTSTSSGTVNVAARPVFTISSTNATCLATNGTVTVAITGGSGQYTYVWTPNVSTSATATNLAAGTYSVVATDVVTSCSETLSTTISSSGSINPVLAPTGPLSICGGNTVTLSTSPETGYTYQWYNSLTPISNNNTNTLVINGSGAYYLTVTDQNGCTGTSNIVEVTAGNAAQPTVTSSGTIGCEPNTIYLGFGPSGVTLTASAPGAVSYLWSNGETTQSITVSTPGVYSLIITDASGCVSQPSAGAEINVNVVDIRCGRLGRKVLLCHVPEGNLGNPQTICIDSSAIPSHLRLHDHDCLGPCPGTLRVVEEQKSVSIYPNPSYDIFTVVCNFASLENTMMYIYDISGRLVMSQPVTAETFEVGSTLTPGIYTINIAGNGNNTTLRMVKTSSEN